MISNKLFWFDVETTGLNFVKHEICQFSAIIVIDGKVVEEIDTKVKCLNPDAAEERALEVNGRTRESLSEGADPENVCKALVKKWSKYTDGRNLGDKFIPAGHNVKFDLDFLKALLQKNNAPSMDAWLSYHFLDTMPIAIALHMARIEQFSSFSLGKLCDHYGIKIEKAHDSLHDIRATRELMSAMSKKMRPVK